MYGFRKPYTAATYEGASFWGIDYKFLLIIAQTAGYVIAKWAGIKIVSEVRPSRRIALLIFLLCFAESMLLLFGLIPRPWNIVCLFLNGLPLGVVFGLVLGCLEGKRNTEALIAGLCASFIVSDGVSKSVGKWLLELGVGEGWMPFLSGMVFAAPTILFVAMLSKVPPPSESDVVNRSERRPMRGRARWKFFMRYAPGLAGVTIVYLFVTLLRSIRADFAPELWRDLGYSQTPAVFTQSELLVSLGVVLVSAMTVLIGNHYRAFMISLVTSLFGFVILLLCVKGWHAGWIGSFGFMVLLGLGVYIPYVAIHTTVFERMIAITREKANIGFLMYLVDSVGYTGYILLMLMKYLMPPSSSILRLFIPCCLFLGIAGVVLVIFSIWWFKIKFRRNEYRVNGFARG